MQILDFNEGDVLGAGHLNQLVHSVNELKFLVSRFDDDSSNETLVGEVTTVEDGLVNEEYPYVKVKLFESMIGNAKDTPTDGNKDWNTFKGYPSQGEYTQEVVAFPSIQALERILVPDSGGTGEVDRKTSNWWMYLLSELYVENQHIRLRTNNGFYFFDVEEYPWIQGRIDTNEGSGKYTLKALTDDGTEIGDIQAYALNGNDKIYPPTDDADKAIVFIKLDRRKNYFQYDKGNTDTFLAVIEGHSTVSTNIWSYSWTESYIDGTPVTGGRSGSDNAFNGAENPNSGSGLEGNGITLPISGVSATMNPITTDDVVVMVQTTKEDGTYDYGFHSPNGIDTECS